MDPELAALASTAAATVIATLTSAAWEQTTQGVAGLWRRVHPERADMIEAELVEAREIVLVGDENAEHAVVGEWQSRLLRLLAADPQAAEELQRLVDRLRPSLTDGDARIERLEMHARASGRARVNQAGRDQHFN
jgi:hypothetical protein